MPTLTTLTLENLLEPRIWNSKERIIGDANNPPPANGGPRHLYISPALYATPEQAPIPDISSPDKLSPSPYVANHKRRRGGNERRNKVPELPGGGETDGFAFEENSVIVEDEVGEEGEGFLDPRSEAVSVGSEVDVSDFNRNLVDSRSFVASQGEFFDAIDEFSSDGSNSNIHSHESRLESELHASKLSLLEEIERRKATDETLILMCIQWERVRNIMSEAGLTFPAPPPASGSMQLESHLIDQMSQEVVVARFVAEAVGRGQARAEAEAVASTIIELKDQEILRLRDRLKYYETVNREMSQRKLVEVARRQQERKRSRRRWLWSFVGLSVAIGASFAAYSCIPRASEYLSLLKSAYSSNTPSSTCLETSE